MPTINEEPTRSGRSLTYVALRKTNMSSVTLQTRCCTNPGVGVRLMLTEPQPHQQCYSRCESHAVLGCGWSMAEYNAFLMQGGVGVVRLADVMCILAESCKKPLWKIHGFEVRLFIAREVLKNCVLPLISPTSSSHKLTGDASTINITIVTRKLRDHGVL